MTRWFKIQAVALKMENRLFNLKYTELLDIQLAFHSSKALLPVSLDDKLNLMKHT